MDLFGYIDVHLLKYSGALLQRLKASEGRQEKTPERILSYCRPYIKVISLALQPCGAQGNLGYIKKEKHTVVGKQNMSLCVCVCEK